MYLHISEQTKIAIKDLNDNFYMFSKNEDILIPEIEITWTKTIYPHVVLLDYQMKIIEEVYEFLKNKSSRRFSFNTVIANGYDLLIFYKFIFINNLKFTNIKPMHINSFISFLVHPNHKNLVLVPLPKRKGKTVNRILSTVRDFYKYLNIFYFISNPFENEKVLINMPINKNGLLAHVRTNKTTKSIYKVKEKTKQIRIIQSDEYHKIFNSFKLERDKLIFKLLFFTGARIGEILSLKIQDIKTINASNNVQSIILSDEIEDENIRRRQKTGTRTLFIPNSLWYELNTYYMNEWDNIWNKIEFEHDYVFITNSNRSKGKPISYSTINSKINEVSRLTKIKFTAHDIRHTFATNLARNKTDISTIQKLLGHKNPSTCAIYIQLAKDEDISKELEKIYKNFE